MVGRRAAVVLWAAAAACGGKPKPDEVPNEVHDDVRVVVPGDAAAVGDAAPGDARPGATTGDLQIRVEWVDVPVIARSSPGRTPCGTPRAPSIAPTTTWGVPDALVMIDGTAGGAADRGQAPAVGGGAAPAATAHVTLADCAIAPRVIVGAQLVITSAVAQPAKLVLRKRGADPAHLIDGTALPVMLPIAGHSVRAALDAGAIYSLDAGDETAWISSAAGAYVTEANGQLTAHELAPGKHAVTAWLPPRAGQPARLGRGTATVVAGELSELTVALTAPGP